MALAAPTTASPSISVATGKTLDYTIPSSVKITREHVVKSFVHVDGRKVYDNEEMTAQSTNSIPSTVFAPFIGQTAQISYSVADESGRQLSDKTDVEIKP